VCVRACVRARARVCEDQYLSALFKISEGTEVYVTNLSGTQSQRNERAAEDKMGKKTQGTNGVELHASVALEFQEVS
jgi:hypothetical protein